MPRTPQRADVYGAAFVIPLVKSDTASTALARDYFKRQTGFCCKDVDDPVFCESSYAHGCYYSICTPLVDFSAALYFGVPTYMGFIAIMFYATQIVFPPASIAWWSLQVG